MVISAFVSFIIAQLWLQVGERRALRQSTPIPTILTDNYRINLKNDEQLFVDAL